jgi:large subunit ribosomal protein L6e
MPRLLTRGLEAYGRSVAYHRSGKWAKKAKQSSWKPAEKKEQAAPAPKVKPFGKKGEKRTIVPKNPRYYPAEHVPHPLDSRKHHHRPTRLRSSITPGTVLILLSGHYRGHRVVFLKQLKSGLLLVTGKKTFSLINSFFFKKV